MDAAVRQAYSYLTAIKFLVEIMMTTWLASLPKDFRDHWLKEARDKTSAFTVRHDNIAATDIEATRIITDAASLIIESLDKVEERIERFGMDTRHVRKKHM